MQGPSFSYSSRVPQSYASNCRFLSNFFFSTYLPAYLPPSNSTSLALYFCYNAVYSVVALVVPATVVTRPGTLREIRGGLRKFIALTATVRTTRISRIANPPTTEQKAKRTDVPNLLQQPLPIYQVTLLLPHTSSGLGLRSFEPSQLGLLGEHSKVGGTVHHQQVALMYLSYLPTYLGVPETRCTLH